MGLWRGTKKPKEIVGPRRCGAPSEYRAEAINPKACSLSLKGAGLTWQLPLTGGSPEQRGACLHTRTAWVGQAQTGEARLQSHV